VSLVSDVVVAITEAIEAAVAVMKDIADISLIAVVK
jgi:hypothetical protein